MTSIGREIQSDISTAIRKEWIVTNGIGGFASSTVPCINARRYHGLLVASLHPPVERSVLVSRTEEIIISDNKTISLSTSMHKDKIINPAGYLHLERFERTPLPTWYYQAGDIMLIKTLTMVYGQNTTVITYKLLTNDSSVTLCIKPHFLFRDFHGNSYANEAFEINPIVEHNGLKIRPFANAPELFVRWDKGRFVSEPQWHRDILLDLEAERGLNEFEDDFSCGYLEINALSNSVSIAFSDSPINSFNPIDIRKREEQRLVKISESLNSPDSFLQKLLVAADQFIVKRNSTDSKTIIAGYPWFSDWGRDSLISLPGLTLVTERFDDARSILKTFASSIRHGMIPNCFADTGTQASYNSVDASLWFFIAIYKYIEYTDDYQFCKDELYDSMSEIIESYINGTQFAIKMDPEDKLIVAGNSNSQLTWMDVKVNNVAITPRNGKAVEVNALWYNALKVYALLQEKFEGHSREISSLAKKVRLSFAEKFWNSNEKCLFDYIDENAVANNDLRPNQIFAVSLPYSLLNSSREKMVVDKVFANLYTSFGLRSLDAKNERYCGIYIGDRFERDSAYHQGTVWGFLIGPFISSFLKVNNYSMSAQLRASHMIEPFKKHLETDACIGNISEIFDGNIPHSARGCFAQAWSVAELLRCYVEDIKGQKKTLIV